MDAPFRQITLHELAEAMANLRCGEQMDFCAEADGSGVYGAVRLSFFGADVLLVNYYGGDIGTLINIPVWDSEIVSTIEAELEEYLNNSYFVDEKVVYIETPRTETYELSVSDLALRASNLNPNESLVIYLTRNMQSECVILKQVIGTTNLIIITMMGGGDPFCLNIDERDISEELGDWLRCNGDGRAFRPISVW